MYSFLFEEVQVIADPGSVVDAPLGDLSVSDRCDRCSAQAFVRVRFAAGALLFCGHHFALHEAGLLNRDAIVDDFRDRINVLSESSA